MKIRIFTLAKELGMDSKVLIGWCQKLGIDLKDSPLSSISEEQRDRVLEFIKSQGAESGEAPKAAAPTAPTRDPSRTVGGKVPTIRPVTPARPATRDDEPEATTPEVPVETAPATVVPPSPPPAMRPVETPPRTPSPLRVNREVAGDKAAEKPVEKMAPAAGPTKAPEPPPVRHLDVPVRPSKPVVSGKPPVLRPSRPPAITRPKAVTQEVPVAPPEEEVTPVEVPVVEIPESTPPVSEPVEAVVEGVDEPPEATEDTAAESTTAPTKSPLAPLRREDYIGASGASGTSRTREMTAIGAVSGLQRDTKKAKARPMPTLPKLAAPPPSPKASQGPSASAPSTGPAQKPEMRISRDMLERTPLHEHIKQHNQDKKRKTDEPGEEFSDEAKKGLGRGPARPMVGGTAGAVAGKARVGKRGGRLRDDEEEASRLRAHRPRQLRRGQQVQQKSEAEIEFPITVRGLSEAMGRRANELIGLLMKKGQMVTINSYLDEEQALELAMECGVDLHIEREKDVEEHLEEVAAGTDAAGARITRPAIVTILGHVDHGKTTLLDKIRSANVAAGEFGGITQHIAAYQVEHNGRRITFLDTPGHAAFAEMRARGANVTDIAVLVVAANDGVMPQTIEALNHARAAGVPIVVAMNKVDLPERNEQRVLQELATQNLLAAEWGGDTEVVRTSGQTGQGIDDLLETLQTVAELGELTGNPEKTASGVCLEAFRDEGRGALVWLIVQDGTLRKGDVVLCGTAYGRIRAMYDDHNREVEEAGPSVPVKVSGLDEVPDAGDRFYVLGEIDEAREIAEVRRQRGREQQLAQRGRVRTLQEILSQAEKGEVQDLPVIIKADTPGSLEALRGEVLKFQHPEVRVNILHDGVGGVNESDVYLAAASGAIIVAFHVIAEDRAEALAEREGVEIRQYNIIYEVTDDIKKAMEGLLKPEVVQSRMGRALVLQTFDISRFGRVAGCRVLNGTIERNSLIRVIRDQRVLHEYKIASLKRGKDDAKEVREGMECGIRLDGFDDVKEGDMFEAIKVEEVKRTL
ncbi:MAG TPA: translation initiation factor IF-2 [Planctomycetaceae bacterium]|nr:translation initiation factor IF-2 [Planctomycetaceae bacterium]